MVEKSWGRHCREDPQGSTLSWTALRPVLTAVPEVMWDQGSDTVTVGQGHHNPAPAAQQRALEPSFRTPPVLGPMSLRPPQTPSTLCGPFWLFEKGVGVSVYLGNSKGA